MTLADSVFFEGDFDECLLSFLLFRFIGTSEGLVLLLALVKLLFTVDPGVVCSLGINKVFSIECGKAWLSLSPLDSTNPLLDKGLITFSLELSLLAEADRRTRSSFSFFVTSPVNKLDDRNFVSEWTLLARGQLKRLFFNCKTVLSFEKCWRVVPSFRLVDVKDSVIECFSPFVTESWSLFDDSMPLFPLVLNTVSLLGTALGDMLLPWTRKPLKSMLSSESLDLLPSFTSIELGSFTCKHLGVFIIDASLPFSDVTR